MSQEMSELHSVLAMHDSIVTYELKSNSVLREIACISTCCCELHFKCVGHYILVSFFSALKLKVIGRLIYLSASTQVPCLRMLQTIGASPNGVFICHVKVC
jgi:hypothetical protein